MLKQILALLNLSLTRNQKYDACTRKIISQTIHKDSTCIDIGCHTGEILDLMIAGAPSGKKIGFEPIPELYNQLLEKYKNNASISIYDVALYDECGTTSFQHVVNSPAYSGIKKRNYDGQNVKIEQITVKTNLLDNIIPSTMKVDLIKIDVEGAEFNVLKGAKTTIIRNKPVIIFEFGLGAADYYNSKPNELFDFLCGTCGMKLATLKGFLKKSAPLKEDDFKMLFEKGKEYYFVSYS